MTHQNTSEQIRMQVEEIYRTEARRIFATLIRLLGDFDLAEDALHDAFREAMEKWPRDGSPGHLRTCSTMWGRYIMLILNEDRPTFKAVNPTTWIKQTSYLDQKFQPSLRAFTAQRAELLPPEAWSRTATVTGAGKPRERTVQTYAQWLAKHEGTHLRQIERIVHALRM